MEPEVVIKLVDFYNNRITQKKILAVLNVSRTTYNRWKKENQTHKEELKLVTLVKNLFKQNKYRYGYRKITYLVNKEIKANKNTLQKITQKHNLNC